MSRSMVRRVMPSVAATSATLRGRSLSWSRRRASRVAREGPRLMPGGSSGANAGGKLGNSVDACVGEPCAMYAVGRPYSSLGRPSVLRRNDLDLLGARL